MRAQETRATGTAAFSGVLDCWPLPVTGGARLALAMSLRARGLRGLDVLRRSQDRAPPAGS